ncbi:MAG: hypothetical protein GXX86_07405 [Propionibacterium sp.]|nr:hypothetical protein [Propionibacterium sp.]
MQILVLGGAGAQAAYAVEKIIADDVFDEVVIADYNKEAADTFVAGLDNPKVRAEQVDVLDKERLTTMMNEATVVANCTGPYYKLLVPVIDALMDSTCKNYVDLCDDIEVFDAVMTPENQAIAAERGMRVIIGLGGSPGLIPIEMMYGNSLMDKAETIKLNMLMDELNEGGPAVWDHMLENFAGEILVWKDNKLQTEQGLEVVDEYDFDAEVFPGVGKVKVYTLGHPEVYTLPKVLPDLKDIVIKTTYYPLKVQEMIVDLDRLGMLKTDPLQVGDVEVSPRAVLIEAMTKNIFNNPEVTGGWDPSYRDQRNLISGAAMEVIGTRDGKPVTYKSGFTTMMGPVTGYPLAVGAAMLARGEIEPTGIMIAEQAVTRTEEFVNEVFTSIERAGHPLRRKAEVIYNLF